MFRPRKQPQTRPTARGARQQHSFADFGLTATEYEFLRVLSLNAGRAVTHRKL
ncbi:MAG: helix-turn-helix domain-containing protein [Bryobacterales bacterium]|nr:helix-turn-helix domain-containing protein [Bryobacterales bacterium]